MKKFLATLLAGLALLPLTSCGPFEYDIEDVSNENSSVFYEIFVGSFYDSDGDGMGDLNGVTQKLDHLVDLGVGGIWLMPIHPSPTYHKYDVTDYYGIAPQYGTIADFENLLDEAEARHIDVLMDLVINHTSSQHPWFTQAVNLYHNGNCYAEDSVCHYYNFSDKSKSGYSNTYDFYYEAQFWSGMPDLNLDNPFLRDVIVDICDFWLSKGVAGFRLDAVTSYYTGRDSANIEFLAWLNSAVKAIKSDAYIVGEGPWGTLPSTIAPYYNSQIDSFFDFPVSVTGNKLYLAIRQETGKTLATMMANYNEDMKTRNPAALDAPFLSNHDQGRVAGLMFPDQRDFYRKLMSSIYLLMPGRPFIYYGEEIDMRGSGIDENKRLPMIWSETDKTGQTNLPIGANYDMDLQVQLGAADQRALPDSLLNHYRKVISVRTKYNSYIEKAAISVIGENEAVYGLRYTTEDGSIDIYTNFSAAAIDETLTGEYTLLDEIPTGQAYAKLKEKSGTSTLTIPAFGTVLVAPAS
jgi:glycosidase